MLMVLASLDSIDSLRSKVFRDMALLRHVRFRDHTKTSYTIEARDLVWRGRCQTS